VKKINAKTENNTVKLVLNLIVHEIFASGY